MSVGRRTPVALVVLSATALVLVALIIGGLVAQRSSVVAEPQATPSGPEGTEPPSNGLEAKVIGALGMLGITGQRAQLPFRDASIWVDFGKGSALFVNAYPLGTAQADFTVIDERQFAGIRVQHVRRPTSPDGTMTARFECSGDEYWVNGTVPPGFADMDAFVERLIPALACSR